MHNSVKTGLLMLCSYQRHLFTFLLHPNASPLSVCLVNDPRPDDPSKELQMLIDSLECAVIDRSTVSLPSKREITFSIKLLGAYASRLAEVNVDHLYRS